MYLRWRKYELLLTQNMRKKHKLDLGGTRTHYLLLSSVYVLAFRPLYLPSELILALKKVLSHRKLGKENLLSIVFVLLYPILCDHGAMQPSHIY